MKHHSISDFSLLDWDSKFFGFNVAILHQSDLSLSMLEASLFALSKKDIRLVYWPAASTIELSKEQLEKLNGILVDKKTTFMNPLGSFFKPCCNHISHPIERANASIPFTNLESLATQCGQHSRFAVDPNMPEQKFIELYTLWLEKSLKKTIADEVLIIREDSYIRALISLIKNKTAKTGEIGLLVVDKKYRKQSLGKCIVNAGLKWFKAHNVTKALVNTQGDNIAACQLYKKCGFFKENVINYYHFWI